jgi:pimeloyl-ACP methyl ester carboxylesterase
MHIPAKTKLPRLDEITVEWGGRPFALPYLYREGTGGPCVFFVHGLGGAKENFYAAFQSPALADCTLLTFDEPGTGLAAFDPDAGLDVSALADMAQSVAAQMLPGPYFLAGASMGGLITLLQLRRHGVGRIGGLINLEGNLCPEDCMFSRRVVSHKLESFEPVFRQMMGELRASRFAGDQIIAHNMALNVDIRAYHAYAFETVAESDSGRLIKGSSSRFPQPLPRFPFAGLFRKRRPSRCARRSAHIDWPTAGDNRITTKTTLNFIGWNAQFLCCIPCSASNWLFKFHWDTCGNFIP